MKKNLIDVNNITLFVSKFISLLLNSNGTKLNKFENGKSGALYILLAQGYSPLQVTLSNQFFRQQYTRIKLTAHII